MPWALLFAEETVGFGAICAAIWKQCPIAGALFLVRRSSQAKPTEEQDQSHCGRYGEAKRERDAEELGTLGAGGGDL